jgi:hypothetical protein
MVCATTVYAIVEFEPVYYGGMIALAGFTGILTWPLIGLVGYHSYLICMNVTTSEHIKSHRRDLETRRNPFDRGSVFSNCYDTLITPCKVNQPVRTFED